MIAGLSRLLRITPRELLALCLVFAATLPAVTSRLYSADEVQYFAYLRSLWFDHDVSFENEYQFFYEHRIAQSEGFHLTLLELTTPAGRRLNYGTIGCAILWAPFYGAADVAVRVSRAAGGTTPADGYSKPYIAAVAYGSAFYGFLAVLLSIGAARRIVGSHGLRSAVTVWLGTPLLFYMYVAPPFAHACSAFAVALVVTIWLEARERWTVGGGVALALAGALMAMVREQDILLAAGPALDCLLTWRRERSAQLATTATAAGVAGIIGYLPQLFAYKCLNGHFGPTSYVTRKLTWYSPHGLQVLLSPSNGFFFWTPLAVLSVAGLVILARQGADRARIGACALLMVGLQAYISGAVESWTVAGAFGQRRFVAVSVLLVIGLASLWSRAAASGRPGRVAVTAVTALAVWWNLALTAEFAIGLMDRQRLDPPRNAYHAFVTLPRLAPELAYRYIFDRASFYKPFQGK